MLNSCPNCRRQKVHFTVSPDWNTCTEEPIYGMNWKCPQCHGCFCNACFEPDYASDGSTFFCPHCKAKLAFPKVRSDPQMPPHLMN